MAQDFSNRVTGRETYDFSANQTSIVAVAGLQQLGTPDMVWQYMIENENIGDGKKAYKRPDRDTLILSKTEARKPARTIRGQTGMPVIKTDEPTHSYGGTIDRGFKMEFGPEYWAAPMDERARKYDRLMMDAGVWLKSWFNQQVLNKVTENFSGSPSNINTITASDTIDNGIDFSSLLIKAIKEIKTQDGYSFYKPDLCLLDNTDFYKLLDSFNSSRPIIDFEYNQVEGDSGVEVIRLKDLPGITIMSAGYTTDSDNFDDGSSNKSAYLLSNAMSGNPMHKPVRRYYSYPHPPDIDGVVYRNVDDPFPGVYTRTYEKPSEEKTVVEVHFNEALELVEPKGVCQIYKIN